MGYSTIFVVGNGFDLNLKLKTSYKEFINSKLVNEYRNSSQNDLIEFLYDKRDLKWIDIERELKNYSKILMIDRTFYDANSEANFDRQKKEFRKDYNELCDILKTYLKESSKEIPSEYTKSAAFKVLKTICSKTSFRILNFNYTDSIKRIINRDFYDNRNYNVNEMVKHVHGSLEKDIVFGVEDNGGVAIEHVFLYKSYNQNQNIQGLRTLLNEARRIVFFGYSLGETDHSYFDDFFKDQSKNGCTHKDLTFYYYDEKAYDNLIVQLNTLTDHRLSKLKQYNSVKFIKVSEIE